MYLLTAISIATVVFLVEAKPSNFSSGLLNTTKDKLELLGETPAPDKVKAFPKAVKVNEFPKAVKVNEFPKAKAAYPKSFPVVEKTLGTQKPVNLLAGMQVNRNGKACMECLKIRSCKYCERKFGCECRGGDDGGEMVEERGRGRGSIKCRRCLRKRSCDYCNLKFGCSCDSGGDVGGGEMVEERKAVKVDEFPKAKAASPKIFPMVEKTLGTQKPVNILHAGRQGKRHRKKGRKGKGGKGKGRKGKGGKGKGGNGKACKKCLKSRSCKFCKRKLGCKCARGGGGEMLEERGRGRGSSECRKCLRRRTCDYCNRRIGCNCDVRETTVDVVRPQNGIPGRFVPPPVVTDTSYGQSIPCSSTSICCHLPFGWQKVNFDEKWRDLAMTRLGFNAVASLVNHMPQPSSYWMAIRKTSGVARGKRNGAVGYGSSVAFMYQTIQGGLQRIGNKPERCDYMAVWVFWPAGFNEADFRLPYWSCYDGNIQNVQSCRLLVEWAEQFYRLNDGNRDEMFQIPWNFP